MADAAGVAERTPTSTTTTSPNRRTRISRRWRRIPERPDARGRPRFGRGVPGHANEGAWTRTRTGAPTPCCMGDCSRLLSRALRWCPDAGRALLSALVTAHARLLREWDAWEEEEEESALAVVAARRSRRSTRRVGRLGPGHRASDAASPTQPMPRRRSDARACRRARLLALACTASGAEDARRVASTIAKAAAARLSGLNPPKRRGETVTLCRRWRLGVGVDPNPADAAEWACAAARTSVEHEGTFTASELHLLAGERFKAKERPARGAAGRRRPVLGIFATGRRMRARRRGEEDDSDDDRRGGTIPRFRRGGFGRRRGSGGAEEESEAAFLARYAAEARRWPARGRRTRASTTDDGEELPLDGRDGSAEANRAVAVVTIARDAFGGRARRDASGASRDWDRLEICRRCSRSWRRRRCAAPTRDPAHPRAPSFRGSGCRDARAKLGRTRARRERRVPTESAESRRRAPSPDESRVPTESAESRRRAPSPSSIPVHARTPRRTYRRRPTARTRQCAVSHLRPRRSRARSLVASGQSRAQRRPRELARNVWSSAVTSVEARARGAHSPSQPE